MASWQLQPPLDSCSFPSGSWPPMEPQGARSSSWLAWPLPPTLHLTACAASTGGGGRPIGRSRHWGRGGGGGGSQWVDLVRRSLSQVSHRAVGVCSKDKHLHRSLPCTRSNSNVVVLIISLVSVAEQQRMSLSLSGRSSTIHYFCLFFLFLCCRGWDCEGAAVSGRPSMFWSESLNDAGAANNCVSFLLTTDRMYVL